MSAPMPVNQAATKEARKRHEAGVKVLRDALARGFGQYFLIAASESPYRNRSNVIPYRRMEKCPPQRTPAEKTRHLRRKRARAARRLNRSR